MKSLILVLLFSATALGEDPGLKVKWHIYNPPGSTTGRILEEVRTRLNGRENSTYRSSDLINYAHEGTHGLNSKMRNAMGGAGWNSFYVGGGFCVVLKEPRITINMVAQRVPSNLRTGQYQLYLVSQAGAWNDHPLYILDEWSAYCNGTQCANEMGIDYGGTDRFMMEFVEFSRILVAVVKERDPNYSDMENLTNFVEWQTIRSKGLLNAQFRDGGGPARKPR